MDLLKNLDNMITAEDYLEKKFPEFEDLDNGNIWNNIEEAMIEFAKLHVEAALKEASENTYFITRDHDMYNREYLKYVDIDPNDTEGDTFCYGGSIVINEDSILNAYPLENIK